MFLLSGYIGDYIYLTIHTRGGRLKVLVQTYDTAFQNVAGGVHNRIVRTVDAIRKTGCIVDYFDQFHTVADQYDILHVFKLDVSNLGLMQYARSRGMKIVLSAIQGLDNGRNIDVYWALRKLPIMTTYKLLFRMCELADVIVTETKNEAEFISKHYHVNANKIIVIPNGADMIGTNSRAIFDSLGKDCQYVLEVARFDKNKNQISVIKALKDTDIEVVFAGGPDFADHGYYEECLKLAKDSPNIHFLGWLDSQSELLKSAYGNAKVLIAPSFYETFGLSIIEGAMAGAVPVISNTLPILGYAALQNCLTCDPNKPEDIRLKIEAAMDSDNSDEFRERIQREFSWNSVAQQHLDLYRGLLDGTDKKNKVIIPNHRS